MNRYDALLGVGVLLVAAFAGPVAAIPSDSPTGPAAQIGTNESTTDDGSAGPPQAPGAQFSAAVEVHQAEVDGEVENRAFGIAIARAASNESKAAAVGDRVQSIRGRLAELRDRERRLTEAYEAGEVSEGRYRAEAAGVAARSAVVARQANATREAAEELPNETLASRGVDADAIETIRRNASSMTGPEVAEIARTVGGPGMGGGLGNANRGPPSDVPGKGNGNGPGSQGAGTNRTAAGPQDSTVTAPGEAGPPGQDSDGPSDDRGGGPPEDRGP